MILYNFDNKWNNTKDWSLVHEPELSMFWIRSLYPNLKQAFSFSLGTTGLGTRTPGLGTPRVVTLVLVLPTGDPQPGPQCVESQSWD